jgi:VWFA-related protein
MKGAAAWLVAALAATLAFAQQPYFETFEVRLHNLDVVVTDAKGNPVHGLTKEDFVILEDGVPQSITNFSVYDSGTGTARAASSQEAAPAAPVQEKPPPRRVVFFVDDMGIEGPTRRTLIRNATAFLDQLQEGDLAAVVRPTGLDRIAQSYTTDTAAVRKALTEAIESCKVRYDVAGQFEIRELRGAIENAASVADRKVAKALYASRSLERVQQRLAQIRALVASMAGMQERKIVVLLVYGMSAIPGRDAFAPEDFMGLGPERSATDWSRFRDLNPEIDELARTAAANGVTIYAIEPELPFGLMAIRTVASKPSGTTHGSGHAGSEELLPQQMLYELLHYRAQTLRSLTEKTGGKWFRGAETMDDLFEQVASDLRVYYSLAYRATRAHDKPRRIEVSVRNRPELRVRTRTEVIDKTPDREMADLVLASLLFPRDVNELRIAVTTGKPAAAGNVFTVPVDVTIPLDALTFLRKSDSVYAASLDIHFAAAGRTNDFTTAGRQQQNVEISAVQYAARKGVTYRFKTALQLPPGPSRIAIGVMDPASRLSGFRTVEVTTR